MAKEPEYTVETREVIFYADGVTINIRNENGGDQEYIKTCGKFVAHYSSGTDTYCVMGAGHPKRCRDKHGRESGEAR